MGTVYCYRLSKTVFGLVIEQNFPELWAFKVDTFFNLNFFLRIWGELPINFTESLLDLHQACANLVPRGSCGPSVWGTSRQDMILKFGTQVKDVKWDPRNFFWVRIFSGGFRMGLQRDIVVPGFWATGKWWEAEILQAASLIQSRTSKFYSDQ